MENIINPNSPEYLLGVLKNIERDMPKAKLKRTSNVVMVSNYLLTHTSLGGRGSSYLMCQYLGIDGDAYTFEII